MDKLITFLTSLSIPAAIGVTIAGGFLFLFAWASYSAQAKKSLKKGTFGVMEILSESREDYGDSSKVPEIARRFSRGGMMQIQRSFSHISGDFFAPESFMGSIRVEGDVAFQYTADNKMAVYGRQKPTNLSMRELVSQKTTVLEIEEDAFKRMNWREKIADCVSIKTQNDEPSVGGSFSFCYRDYVNHEELMGMMCKRYGIEGFLFKPSRAGILTVDKDSKRCLLTERSKLFRIIPLCIKWEGILKEGTIHWHSTSLTMGWESFGKFFDKPAAAEKLIKNPWHVSIPKDDSTGDILCFDREGKGHLVFAKEKCLSGGLKKNSL